MDRPIYECIAYDLGNELQDLKKFKEDLEKYTDHLEEKLSEQLIIADVSNSTSGKAQLIEALNNTLIANKQIGTYKGIERNCIDRLDKLIKSI